MPQGPILVKAVAPSYGLTDVTAAAVIKALPGVLAQVIINTAGTAGSLTFNNTTTTGGATTANQIITIAFGSLTVGEVLNLNFPCSAGIVLSAIPTGGVISIAYS